MALGCARTLVASSRAALSSGIVMSPSCSMISAKKPRCGSSLPLPFGRPCGAASARPVRRIASAHRAPVAGESFRRNAAARPLNPSSMYRRNRARSASGNGADMIHPPNQDEAQSRPHGNPPDSGFGRDALEHLRKGAPEHPRPCRRLRDAGPLREGTRRPSQHRQRQPPRAHS